MTELTSQPTKRILIADDDPVMRHLMTSIVRKEGYDAVVVEDGREAYRILQSDADFKAGVFDMVMPHLEGIDVIRYMRTEKRLQRIPILMVSAEQDLNLMAKSFVAGATVFLTKPFDPNQFQSTLRTLLISKSTPTRSSQG
jgi:two-component system chemotaxis response regulator CheY